MPFLSQAAQLHSKDKPPPVFKRKGDFLHSIDVKKRKTSVAPQKVEPEVKQEVVKKREQSSVRLDRSAQGVNTRPNGKAPSSESQRGSAKHATVSAASSKIATTSKPISCHQCGSTKTYAWRHDAEGNKICDKCRSRNISRQKKEATERLKAQQAQSTSTPRRSPSRRSAEVRAKGLARLSPEAPKATPSTTRRVSETRPAKAQLSNSHEALSRQKQTKLSTPAVEKLTKSASPELRSSRKGKADADSTSPGAQTSSEPRRSSRGYKGVSVRSKGTRVSPPVVVKPKPAESPAKIQTIAATTESLEEASDKPESRPNSPEKDKSVKRCVDCDGTSTAGTWRKEKSGGVLCNRCMVRRWRARKSGSSNVSRSAEKSRHDQASKLAKDAPVTPTTRSATVKRSSARDAKVRRLSDTTIQEDADSVTHDGSPKYSSSKRTSPSKPIATSPYSLRKAPVKTTKSAMSAEPETEAPESPLQTLSSAAKNTQVVKKKPVIEASSTRAKRPPRESRSSKEVESSATAPASSKKVVGSPNTPPQSKARRATTMSPPESSAIAQNMPKLALFALPPASPRSRPQSAAGPSTAEYTLPLNGDYASLTARCESAPLVIPSREASGDQASTEVALLLKRAREEQEARDQSRALSGHLLPTLVKHEQRQSWTVRPQAASPSPAALWEHLGQFKSRSMKTTGGFRDNNQAASAVGVRSDPASPSAGVDQTAHNELPMQVDAVLGSPPRFVETVPASAPQGHLPIGSHPWVQERPWVQRL